MDVTESAGGDERGGEHEEELAEDQVHAGDGAGKYVPSCRVPFRPRQVMAVHASVGREDYHVADDAAEGRAADLFGGGDVVLLDFKRFESRFRGGSWREVVVNDAVAVFSRPFWMLPVAMEDSHRLRSCGSGAWRTFSWRERRPGSPRESRMAARISC